jgi:hypothetical protein
LKCGRLVRQFSTVIMFLRLLLLLLVSIPGLAAPPPTIFTYDLAPLRRLNLREGGNAVRVWDTVHVLSALQGLVNRDSPRLYLFYCSGFGVDTDKFWFDWFRGEDGWLSNSSIEPLADLEAALRTFRESYDGLVVYDPAVPATSNVASTAAGCDRLLPVRYDPAPDSIYAVLTQRLKIPVKLWLINPDGSSKFTGKGNIPDTGEASSGSAKVDAYRWAVRNYMQPGKCDARFAAYYIDSFWLKVPTQSGPDMHTLCNQDFFISRRAFFFDLSPWADEVPNDDPSQPLGADRQEFLAVLRALYDRAGGSIIKVGGFPPWPFKYTDSRGVGGKHAGVPTEWEFGRLISQYNGYMEADAAGLSAMANASFYQHYPLAARYAQPNKKPTLEDWKTLGYATADGKVAARTFVGHYVGDYDAPSWLYKAVPSLFADAARGEVPLGWAFDPGLSDRVPQALAYAYRHATTNDYFIAGDSGAGYLNARALTVRPESGLPPGLEAWTEYCGRYYERWGMTITGFVLDGSGGASTDTEFAAYRRFSPDGLGTHFERGPAVHVGVPTCVEKDLPNEVEKAAAIIAREAAANQSGPLFLWKRSILRRPQWYADLSNVLKTKYPEAKVEVVDPYTFFGLIKLHSLEH